MKNLLKNGFIRREDLDFTDDGSRFTAYEYNGLVITKCTYRGEYYISVRVDYLRGKNFIWEDYHNKEWYKLCDEFNGVSEVDVDKLKANMDIIKKGVEELEEEVAKDPIDTEAITKQLEKERLSLQTFLDNHKIVDITKFDSYTLRRLVDYFESLKNKLETINTEIENKNYGRYQYYYIKEGKTVAFNINDNYFVKNIIELLGY